MTKRDGKQAPIYFVSRALQGPEVNYTPMEKLILALVSASKPLKGYFQAHTIVVITDQPIKQLLSSPEVTGRLLKWRFRLGEHDIQYRPRTSVNRIYIAKESSMVRYLEKVKNLASTFKGFSIKQIPKGENKKADALSKIASTSFAHLRKQVLVEELREKAIDEKEILAIVEEGHTWMTPVYEYLTEGVLPEEKKKLRTICRKAGRYAVISEVLYKKSFLGPWLRCVGSLQANYVLREIHEGSCSMHAGPTSMVAKALRFGLPGEVISKNGKQFKDSPFKDWCEKLNIRQCFTSVKHPQANGLVERANRSLGEGIKALIPTEIGMATLRTAEVDVDKNNEALGISLDLLEEKKEQASI
nr:reverse transcriptase domain-containing protein [Tanacetum cinerariifolium]